MKDVGSDDLFVESSETERKGFELEGVTMILGWIDSIHKSCFIYWRINEAFSS